MCRFIETIRLENEQMPLIEWHEKRFARTQIEAYGKIIYPSLRELIENNNRQSSVINCQEKIKYKCRVEYGENDFNIELTPYVQKEIHRLKIVEGGNINYALKYADRAALNDLGKGISSNEEILIVKDGLLTDTSFTNIALFNGDKWVTPSTPLLQGVQRAFLLEKGILMEYDIPVTRINAYTQIKLFNAMVNWEEAWVLEIEEGSALMV